jgi:hypothetical protein
MAVDITGCREGIDGRIPGKIRPECLSVKPAYTLGCTDPQKSVASLLQSVSGFMRKPIFYAVATDLKRLTIQGTDNEKEQAAGE